MKQEEFVVRKWTFPVVNVPNRVSEVQIRSNSPRIELVGATTTTHHDLGGLEDLANAITAAIAQLKTWKIIKAVYPEETGQVVEQAYSVQDMMRGQGITP